MGLTSNLSLQRKAQTKKYAVGAFNISNIEILQSVLSVATRLKSPVIISTTPSAISYAGLQNISCVVRNEAKKSGVPVSLHLDHGKSFDDVKMCVDAGYSSVMIDASDKSFLQNIKLTKKVVSLAHKKGVSVESELGVLCGVEDNVNASENVCTVPAQAKEFVERTGTDTLAVAIGTSHGAYKFKATPKLRFDILKEIRSLVKTPLVLHGASGVPSNLLTKLKSVGVGLGKAKGVPDAQIRKAILEGVTKVNIDTDIRLAFTYGVKKFLGDNKKVFDPRKILGNAKKEMEKIVEQKMLLFGSKNQATN
ncbi:class II fructose-bisphosphate aldolase [Candidatus Woesearchaeota archaeon]|nr:class II fructose-bisphosphate aldolase [Candidatus Woesearchaeota archaeon]